MAGEEVIMEQKKIIWPRLFQQIHISATSKLAIKSGFIIGTITHIYAFTNMLLTNDGVTALYGQNNVWRAGRITLQWLSIFGGNFQLPVVIGLISVLALAVNAALTVQILEVTHPVSIVLVTGFIEKTIQVIRRQNELRSYRLRPHCGEPYQGCAQ